MSPLLEISGVTRTFPMPDAAPLEILQDVDLVVEPGDHVAIVGRSGTGKSTLLNILGLLDRPTSGRYLLDAADTARMGEGRRARLRGATFGFVFQSFNLIPGLSTTENVAAPLLYDHGAAFWTRSARAEELLDAVGLGEKVGARIDRLSGGEQQRVAIARALARHPRVILADEPTGALDVDTGASVMGLLETQCRESGAALITITHDLAVAARARTQYRLDHGVLTRIEVASHRVGSLEEFAEVVPGAGDDDGTGNDGAGDRTHDNGDGTGSRSATGGATSAATVVSAADGEASAVRPVAGRVDRRSGSTEGTAA